MKQLDKIPKFTGEKDSDIIANLISSIQTNDFFLFYKYFKPYQTLILVENNHKSKTDYSCSASPRPYQLLCRYPGNHCESRSNTSTNRTKHVSDIKEGRKEEKRKTNI